MLWTNTLFERQLSVSLKCACMFIKNAKANQMLLYHATDKAALGKMITVGLYLHFFFLFEYWIYIQNSIDIMSIQGGGEGTMDYINCVLVQKNLIACPLIG